MKKSLKVRVLAAFLVLSMIAAPIATGSVSAGAEDKTAPAASETSGTDAAASSDTVLYEEDFDGTSIDELRKAGWTLPAAGIAVSNGALALNATAPIQPWYKPADVKDWTDYSLEADITLKSADNSNNNDALAELVAYATGDKGYEFGLMVLRATESTENVDDFHLRMYGRAAEALKGGAVNSTSNKSIPGAVSHLKKDVAYKIRIDVNGDTVSGYVNNVLVLRDEKTNPDTEGGGIGLRCQNATCTVDNIRVFKPAAEEETVPSGWFYEDFSEETVADLKARGWENESTDKKSDNNLWLSDGAFHNTSKVLRLSGLKGTDAAAWKDYTVEADITLGGVVTEKGKDTFNGAIVGRGGDGGAGYEFALLLDKASNKISWRLFRRGATSSDNLVIATQAGSEDTLIKDCVYEAGKTYRLKLVMKGNNFSGSITPEGEREMWVFENVTDDGLTNGYPGFRISNGLAKIDNFSVSGFEGEYFKEDFSAGAVDDAWEAEGTAGSARDGGYVIPPESPVSGLYLTKFPSSDIWDDYTVSTDVTTGAVSVNRTSGAVGVAARVSNVGGKYTGYVFSLMIHTGGIYNAVRLAYFDESGNQHFLHGDGDGKETQSSIKGIIEDANLPKKGGTVRLKMEVKGNAIKCYLGVVKDDGSCDEKLVYSVEDVSKSYPDCVKEKGTAGIATRNCSATYKSLTVTASDTETEDPDDLFFEPFTPKPDGTSVGILVPRGWSHEAEQVTPTGAQLKSSITLNNEKRPKDPKDALEWDKYIVEADLMIQNHVEDEEHGVTLMGHTTGASGDTSGKNNGYGFSILFNGDFTVSYARLYMWNDDGSGGQIKKVQLPEVLEISKYYHLKMAFDDADGDGKADRVLCYLGDDPEPVIDYYVTNDKGTLEPLKLEKGSVGIRNPWSTVWADNLRVHTDFTEIQIPEIQMSYVKPDLNEGEWFYDDFESSSPLSERGWSGSDKDSHSGKLITKEAHIVDGEKKDIWKNPAGETPDKWTDYRLSAKVTAYRPDSANWPKNNGKEVATVAAGIVGHTANYNSGYEFRLVFHKSGGTYVDLYDRSAGIFVKEDTPMTLVSGVEYVMAMVFKGDRICCYLNDTLVFDATVNPAYVTESGKKATPSIGSIGVRSAFMTADYDDVLVSAIPDDFKFPDANTKKYAPGEVWFSDDFETEGFLTERGWHTDDTKIEDGKLRLGKGGWVNGILEIPGSDEWDNYVLEADMLIPAIPKEDGSAGACMAIVARASTYSNGYEFGLIGNGQKLTYRLLDRAYPDPANPGKTSAKALATTGVGSVTQGETVHLRMAVVGNRIRCWVNGGLVFDITDEHYKKGSVRFVGNGYAAYIDNVKVTGYIASMEADWIKQAENQKSPKTGDAQALDVSRKVRIGICVCICVAAAAVTGAVLAAPEERNAGRKDKGRKCKYMPRR